jgi:mannose/fructose/N-acetylgalactosamine-specific phosphotransferase system component IIB
MQDSVPPRPPVLCWVRVDDRLIHGQVIVAWRRHLGYDEICIVDDGVRADPFMREVLRMAVPPGIRISVYALEEAIPLLKAPATMMPPRGREGKVLLLLKTPQTALSLLKGGVPIPHLNIGNLAGGARSWRAFKSISLGAEHVATLDALAREGVRITFQLTPDDTEADWPTVRRRLAGKA